jgi:RNA polymerase sigma factor (sigma-70 family)
MTGDKIPADQLGELADCFVAHAGGLFGYAYVLTRGDRALAEDLVQSTFAAATMNWTTIRGLHDPQRLRWLRTTIGNLAISVFRQNAAFRDRLPRLDAQCQPPVADTPAEALSAVALERCWQTMLTLPPQQHAVAVMRWLFGMKNREIVDELGIASGTVAAHVFAARAKLRASLGPFDPFGDDEEGPPS